MDEFDDIENYLLRGKYPEGYSKGEKANLTDECPVYQVKRETPPYTCWASSVASSKWDVAEVHLQVQKSVQ